MKRIPIRTYLLGALLAIAGTTAWAATFDINTATVSDLTSIGFSLTEAKLIVADRPLGGYLTTKDVLKVPGVTQGMLNKVRSKMTIDGNRITTRSGTAPAIPGVSPAIPGNPTALTHSTEATERTGLGVGEGVGAGHSGDHGGGHGGGNGHSK